jgi:hypothetical protein
MDERIISLLEEQNALLKKHLWRLRFSLLTLLLLTTGLCVGLGYVTYRARQIITSMPMPAPTVPAPFPSQPPIPAPGEPTSDTEPMPTITPLISRN